MHNLERVYCVWKVFLYLLKTQEAVHLRAFQHYKCISTFFELATTLKIKEPSGSQKKKINFLPWTLIEKPMTQLNTLLCVY